MRASRILAIDTATEVCSVAVLDGDQLHELTETVGQKHSERVLPMIDTALAGCRLSLIDIDLVAFGAGPGSFTGLRIACGIAQGLAHAQRKPVVPVGNLRALASRAFETGAEGDKLLAAIDARMNEVYFAVYQRDAAISELSAPALATPQAVVQLALREGIEIVAGNALRVFADAWPADGRWRALPDVVPSAADVARLARGDAVRGLSVAAAEAAPLYVRDQVAMTIEQRRALHASKQRSTIAAE